MSTYAVLVISVVLFSLGYFFGRYQQRNLDGEVPVLFIIWESQDENVKYDIRPYLGEWIPYYDEIGEYVLQNGIVVRFTQDNKYCMYFHQEVLQDLKTERDFLYATVNIASYKKIKRWGEDYLLSLVNNSKKIDI